MMNNDEEHGSKVLWVMRWWVWYNKAGALLSTWVLFANVCCLPDTPFYPERFESRPSLGTTSMMRSPIGTLSDTTKAAVLRQIFTILDLWMRNISGVRLSDVGSCVAGCFHGFIKNIVPSSPLVNSRKLRRFKRTLRTTYMAKQGFITDNINPSQIRCGKLKYCDGIFTMGASVFKRNVNTYTLSWVEVQTKCILILNIVLIYTKIPKLNHKLITLKHIY
jgi:hypothetical protein